VTETEAKVVAAWKEAAVTVVINRGDIIETLEDWGYLGPVASRPDWYTPAAHWGAGGPMGEV
jgi:hypothetical protein